MRAGVPAREDGPSHRRLSDEEVVAAVVKVVLEEGHVVGQERLRDLVLRALKSRNRQAGLTPARARRLAVLSGLVSVETRVRAGGPAPDRLERCPVCGSALARIANRTLTGGKVASGYRCARCGWWTGAREMRVPARYAFAAKLERAGGQTRFRRREKPL